ncbi:FG-GAP repeat domain-containing protein [Candidatus Palauibacter sp.]|uniref:FG-GAP repeat domain-containing protein n=1 Tax=Candidatus Palauibacter sp. TaxID=3101350 RepID=UPI003AF3002B
MSWGGSTRTSVGRGLPTTILSILISACGEPATPSALWHDATAALLPPTAEWTNKVELADIDGDGRIDLLFANGGNYSEPGDPEPNRAFVNRGPGQPFEERTTDVFGAVSDLARVIKARDFNGDGQADIFVGTTYQTQSRLFLGAGGGAFRELTATHLPPLPLSLGDAEPGDVDGDGDLDLVLADWGPGNNMTNEGGRTRLWVNDGRGRFTDVTADRMPATLMRFSWDLELVDVDNDFDLDVLVSCKRCGGSSLFRNDGTGTFEEDPRGLPQYTNNYEFEAMDLDGDDFLDLVTVNDGEIVGERSSSRREHVFRNDGEGSFRDATDVWWPASENIGEDDNVVAFLDFDSDGDADFLIGSLSGPDRLLVNDGGGRLRAALDVFTGEETPGTLGMALADLDGDGRIDVVQSQGEHPTAVQERVFLGRGLDPDTVPPVVSLPLAVREADSIRVVARIHDRKSPSVDAEWRNVHVTWSAAGEKGRVPMRWYGEYLWRARIPPDTSEATVCASDASGNQSCAAVHVPVQR